MFLCLHTRPPPVQVLFSVVCGTGSALAAAVAQFLDVCLYLCNMLGILLLWQPPANVGMTSFNPAHTAGVEVFLLCDGQDHPRMPQAYHPISHPILAHTGQSPASEGASFAH